MEKMNMPETQDIHRNVDNHLDKFKSEKGMRISEAKKYSDMVLKEAKDAYYTDYNERIDRTPKNGENGTYEGERGESKYKPSEATEAGRLAKEKLAEYGLDGIMYKNGFPDFSKCSEGTVKISGMTENRKSNFDQADIKMAEQWSREGHEGKNEWSAEDVKNYRNDKHLIWHECEDTKTMQLVSGDIHPDGRGNGIFTHSGGVAECKIRDQKVNGGGFDE